MDNLTTQSVAAIESATLLAPCPFCGPVEIVHRWAGNVEIKHKNACFLHAITTLRGAAHIAAWNRRANATAHVRDRSEAEGT